MDTIFLNEHRSLTAVIPGKKWPPAVLDSSSNLIDNHRMLEHGTRTTVVACLIAGLIAGGCSTNITQGFVIVGAMICLVGAVAYLFHEDRHHEPHIDIHDDSDQ